MWKARVRTCLETAIGELVREAGAPNNPEMTIRTELDRMVRQTRLQDVAKRLREILREVEALPDAGKPKA